MKPLIDKTADFMAAIAEAKAFIDGDHRSVRIRQIEPVRTEILEARLSLGLTQEEFAAALGVSTSGLRKWEQGQRQPNGAVLILMRLIRSHPDIVKSAFTEVASTRSAAE